MGFALPDHWVWDFWLADDGERYHMFYLHAPKSLGHPDMRHRNARIGHATSPDLREWQSHGAIFAPGAPGTFDGTANWTGSVTRGDDGRWWLYYTGSHFLTADRHDNVETVGCAVSDDLFGWQKLPGPICRADPRWYETLRSSDWPEEAWRDPWVFKHAGRWHMLVTARANHGELMGRGIIAHATSDNMLDWQVQPPLSTIDSGFAHIEVPQIVEVEGQSFLVWCCDRSRLSGPLDGQIGGIWAVAVDDPLGPYDIARANLVADEALYAGRVAFTRSGQAVLLAFNNVQNGAFVGTVADPMPLTVRKTADGLPQLVRADS